MWMCLVQALCVTLSWMITVKASEITYYMDDYQICGTTIKDANMGEDDVYQVLSHQWAQSVSSARYTPVSCSLTFDFVSKQVKLDFESFRISDCDTTLIITDGAGSLVKSLKCDSSMPEPFTTTTSSVHLSLKRGNTKNFFYSIKVTAEGHYVPITSGVVAGIVIGIVFLVLAIVAAVVTFVICHKRNKMRERMRLAYQSPAILEREEGLTIVNRLGISYEEIPRELPRPNHRRAYRSSYTSVASQHTPTDEGPPPYQSLPDLAHRRSRTSRGSHVAEPENVSNRSLVLTASDYADGSADQSCRTVGEEVFISIEHDQTLSDGGSPLRSPAQASLGEARSLTEQGSSPLPESRTPERELGNVSPSGDSRSALSETSQTESAQNDSGRSVGTPTSAIQGQGAPLDDYRPRNILHHPAF